MTKNLNKNGFCKDILLLYLFYMTTACVTIATVGLTGSRPVVGLIIPDIKLRLNKSIDFIEKNKINKYTHKKNG